MNTATATALPIDQATAAPPPGSLREDAMVISLVGLAHASSHFSHLLLPALFPVFMKAFFSMFLPTLALGIFAIRRYRDRSLPDAGVEA